jgi:hypothetical protein
MLRNELNVQVSDTTKAELIINSRFTKLQNAFVNFELWH